MTMADPNATRPSLLVQIRDAQDQHAWSQFVELYAPLIYGFARKHALQDADAADLTQEVLRTVARTVQTLNYDPTRGSFRGWLFTVVRNKLRDFISARSRRAQASGGTSDQQRLLAMPDPTSDESAEWDLDHERRLFAWAGEKVRAEVEETTWQAFWQTAVEGRSGQEVASNLGLSVAAVYLAKSRVMARLKDKIKEIEN
jgi:RNA polymerase sigma-70 factor (ECF subfamily)